MKHAIIMLLSCLVYSCTSNNKYLLNTHLNKKIDQWHNDAAIANFDRYFEFIAEDGVFIGTDISERWTKIEFEEFSKPYFDNGKAWSFVPKERTIRFNEAKDIAWFDETLSTWMGACRSTGVLALAEKEWYIKHYQLSVTIDNEKMEGFLKLTQEKE